MKIRVGDKAPDVTLQSQSSQSVSLSGFSGKKNVVLYFYPKDFTVGCTKEAVTFGASYEELKRLDAEVIGISSDDLDTHKRFSESCNLPYPLLSDAEKKVRDDGKYMVSVRTEKRYFLKHELEMSGHWVEVPVDRLIDKQDGEEIEPFERTTRVEVDKDGFVPIERLEEYKFKEVYQLSPDTDKRVKETTARVKQLARYLLEKHTALVAFFSWGRGYQFYTAVVYPYERKDGKLWLLMGMSEGILKLDTAWALESEEQGEGLPPVPQARKKRKVTISK